MSNDTGPVERTGRPPRLTAKMAEELAFELQGLQGSADDPDQYNDKIAALFAIADGLCRVVCKRRTEQR